MGLISTLILCALLGWLAQGWKGRSGVGWFFFALGVWFMSAFVVFLSAELHAPDLWDTPGGVGAFWIMSNLIGGGISALIIAALRSLKNRPNRVETA